jgi:hypothetical protein
VEEHRSLAGEAGQLASEELARRAPAVRIGEVRGDVLVALGSAAADVEDPDGSKRNRVGKRPADSARGARDDDEIGLHGFPAVRPARLCSAQRSRAKVRSCSIYFVSWYMKNGEF